MVADQEQEISSTSDRIQACLNSVTQLQGTLPDLASHSIEDATFRLMADNLPTLAWVANGDGFIVWYNRRLCNDKFGSRVTTNEMAGFHGSKRKR